LGGNWEKRGDVLGENAEEGWKGGGGMVLFTRASRFLGLSLEGFKRSLKTGGGGGRVNRRKGEVLGVMEKSRRQESGRKGRNELSGGFKS